jgi:uncharacterized membrane protein
MKYKILLVLFLIALITTIVLALTPVSQICDPTKGCDLVQHSSYSKTFGINNAYFGIILFALASLILFLQIKKTTEKRRKLIHVMVFIGAIVATYLIYVQHYIIGAYCKYCMIIDLSMIAALIVVIFYWKE